MNCTFAGHRDVYLKNAERRIEEVIYELCGQYSDICFYSGGMGEFDYLCARTVKRVKLLSPGREIKLFLVVPYMMQRINRDREDLNWIYDEIIIPDELSGCHHKRAISARNRCMVDRCEYLIAHVVRQSGGAWNTLRYAYMQGVRVLNLTDD